jgi:hypothetical protein
MIACPECNEPYPSESILLRHRQNDHPEEYAAALEAEGSARAAQEAADHAEGRFTDDGFLRRIGAKRQTPPTDPSTLLGGLFPSADPGAALPPWDREVLEGGRE